MSFLSQSEAERLSKVQERKSAYEERQKQKKEDAEKAKQEKLQAIEKAKKNSEQAAQKTIEDIKKQYQATLKKQPSKTSAEVLANAKATLGNLFNSIITPVQNEVSEAWNKSNGKTIDAARQQVQSIYQSSIWGKTAGERTAILGLSPNNVLSNTGMLSVQEQLLTGKLSQTVIIDMIANQVFSKKSEMKAIVNGSLTFYDVQKTYISQYIIGTFGNPEFVNNIKSIVHKNVADYVNSWSTEMLKVGEAQLKAYTSQFDSQLQNASKQITDFSTKLDSTFEKVMPTIETTTKRITEKLDNIDKINILQSINNNITDLFSMKSIQDKLKTSPLGAFTIPIISSVGTTCGIKINTFLSNKKNINAIKQFSNKLKTLSKQLTAAKTFITEKLAMVKEFVNNLKQKALSFVTEFANKIVADISSKISINLSGVLSI